MFSKEEKINAILDYIGGLGLKKTMAKYGIKSDATIYQWVRLFKEFGLESLDDHSKQKTKYDYSFKIKIIKWRVDKQASFPVAAQRFGIKHPSMIWFWERALESGRLRPKNGHPTNMTNENNKANKELEEENRYLKVRVAYLEKLHALTQKKKNLPTEKKHK